MLNSKVIVFGQGKIFGPFENQKIADAWLENHDDIRENCELYSLWEVQAGTAERAMECGTRLAAAA